MPDAVISILSVAVVLGIMVLVHEWGHFVAAKFFGVRVDVFSFGFGPRLWGWKRGPTDYRLSALPLGGYVRMAGDNPSEDRKGDPDEFLSKPRWQRAIIAVAGPAMNVVMAVVVVTLLYTVGMPEPAYLDRPVEIGGVLHDSPAEKSGIQVGDRVAEINGVKDPTWAKLEMQLQLADPGKPISLVLGRGGELIPISLPPGAVRSAESALAVLGVPREPVIVGRVANGMPAERSGIRPGDQIVAINGAPVLSQLHLSNRIQQIGGQPADFLIQRGDRQMHLTIRPSHGDPGDGRPRWQIGIGFSQENIYRSYPFPQAVSRAVVYNVRQCQMVFQVLSQLLQAKVSIKQLEGPVGIAQLSGQYAKMGVLPLLTLMAVLSINLAILNLLPIPILDGGHIFMLAVEGSLRRDLSVAAKERYVQVGLVMVLLIIAIATYNDISRLLPSH